MTRAFVTRGIVALLMTIPASATHAQYFGRNKVQYERFKFDVLRTKHFDLHYYDDERVAARDAARMLERWNTRLSSLFTHPLSARKPIVLYADQPDFQQTNVIGDQLDESTGGVTESMLDRMVLPLTGSYAESDHVLGHEMVHVFQYDIAEKGKGGLTSLERLPLWLIEGMAEYLSLGGRDPHTAMWLRDATLRNDIPTIKQLMNGQKYFPYRYGEALWAYIGGTWGDDMVPRLFRASLEHGLEDAVKRVLGMSVDSLSARWRSSIKTAYGSASQGRTAPTATGDRVLFGKDEAGAYNLSPALSPDGRSVAFFSSRGLRGIQLMIADAETGRIRTSLANPGVSSHFDALSFLYSAGSWSPDNRKLAFVTYADGDNEIGIVDVESKRVERRIRPKGIGAVTTVAWSPDGKTIAFSGMKGGISDLYGFDLASGDLQQLTNDRFADLQPTWSPDGRTIAFASDRGDGDASDFDRLRYAPLRLTLLDVASKRVRVIDCLGDAKHINPQFSSDGRSVYFVSDRGGFSDIYRVELETGALFQVTRVSTGVTGVTATSPAFSVARGTGRVLFSVFHDGGFHIAGLPAERAQGESLGTGVAAPDAGLLPAQHGTNTTDGIIARYLRDADGGLPGDSTFKERGYAPGFRLAAVGQPSLGASFGGVLGTQIIGGASAYFSDMLGDHSLGVAVQASGQLRDLGGQLMYLNTARRWNWGASIERIPYVYGYASNVDYVLAHIALTGASALAQYPVSQTRRIELTSGYTRYDYHLESIQATYNRNGGIDTQRETLPAPSSLGLAEASAAYVGDDTQNGFTGPIAGTRYRLQVTPTVGSLTYETLLLDFRKYVLFKPVTLALRGLHYGRYGKDSDSDRLGSLYLGDGSLVRGYSYDSFNSSECSNGSGSLTGSTCPQFDRLLGSRLAMANVELRIPLVGMNGLGLLRSSAFPPVEIAPFVDAGVAWTGNSAAVWQLATNSTDRTPVASAGIAARVNLFGFAVLQTYWARPFQRPGQGGVFGFVLQPGW
jgi:hypothetical protein